MALPSHSTARVVQARAGTPSMSTVQLPQPPRSHISRAPPCSPQAFSSVSRRVHWGSTCTFNSLPLMLSVAHWGMPQFASGWASSKWATRLS